MDGVSREQIDRTRAAALRVLLRNARGPVRGLPRTAGWGYPEPYTRDLMISLPGMLMSGSDSLVATARTVLETLARNPTRLGHIPSLVHDPEDRGASDTTPLFLLGTGFFRKAVGEPDFLAEAVHKALTWMEYQSPSDRSIVAQQPTSDWRDEQWVMGFGLYVNTLVYACFRLYGRVEQAAQLKSLMSRFTVTGGTQHRHVHEGLVVKRKPYYALWSYKIYSSERFDLLGNSLAILAGIASPSRAGDLISWVEEECAAMRTAGELAGELPPNLFPFIQPGDPDWRPRYDRFNRPGHYHNGGLWPFIAAFYTAALVAAGRYRLAEKKLLALTECVRHARTPRADIGFNEWYGARDGAPMGEDHQTWSAAMYLYAVECVHRGKTMFFDEIRGEPDSVVPAGADGP